MLDPATPETRYARTRDGLHIAYQTLGEGVGVDVLRVAAYYSNLEHDWEQPVVAHMGRSLAELGRLISFDGRGAGLSDPIGGDRLPTLEERIDDMRAVLDAAGSERPAVVAFADAGPLCLLFAATHPDRTLALVLCNTRARTAWAPDYPWGATPEEQQAELGSIADRWGTRELAEEIVRETHPHLPPDETMVDWWAAHMRRAASPSSAAKLARMYFEMDVRAVLPAIHVPTLVLSTDPVAEESDAMAAAIPGAQRIRIPGAAPVAMANPDPFIAEIKRFVRRVEDEEADLERVLATVLFTDIVGSTERAAELGDRGWRDLVEQHHAFVRAIIARWRGREMDTAGDGFFAAFDGPARGIRCAQAIVDGVRSMGVEVRAGIHTGECEIIDGKVGGLSVVIGARVASKAGPSQILVSKTVKDLVVGSGLAFEEAGEHELKGIPDRWTLYRLLG